MRQRFLSDALKTVTSNFVRKLIKFSKLEAISANDLPLWLDVNHVRYLIYPLLVGLKPRISTLCMCVNK